MTTMPTQARSFVATAEHRGALGSKVPVCSASPAGSARSLTKLRQASPRMGYA